MADIKFQCQECEQPLEAPEEMAGDVIECPACEQNITVPVPVAEPARESAPEGPSAESPFPNLPNLQIEEPYSESSRENCPECGEPLAEGSVLCLACGFHTKLGKKINTEFE